MKTRSDDPVMSLLEVAASIARLLRNGSYSVTRGAVDWAKYPFTEKMLAVSIMCDECGLIPQNTADVPNVQATLTIEMFARREDRQDSVQGIDDKLMSNMRADARKLVEDLLTAQDENHDSIVLGADTGKIKAIETHDVQLRVQGLIVTFGVSV